MATNQNISLIDLINDNRVISNEDLLSESYNTVLIKKCDSNTKSEITNRLPISQLLSSLYKIGLEFPLEKKYNNNAYYINPKGSSSSNFASFNTVYYHGEYLNNEKDNKKPVTFKKLIGAIRNQLKETVKVLIKNGELKSLWKIDPDLIPTLDEDLTPEKLKNLINPNIEFEECNDYTTFACFGKDNFSDVFFSGLLDTTNLQIIKKHNHMNGKKTSTIYKRTENGLDDGKNVLKVSCTYSRASDTGKDGHMAMIINGAVGFWTTIDNSTTGNEYLLKCPYPVHGWGKKTLTGADEYNKGYFTRLVNANISKTGEQCWDSTPGDVGSLPVLLYDDVLAAQPETHPQHYIHLEGNPEDEIEAKNITVSCLENENAQSNFYVESIKKVSVRYPARFYRFFNKKQ